MARRLTAILAADVVGYVKLMAEDEDQADRALQGAGHLLGDPILQVEDVVHRAEATQGGPR